MVNSNFAHAAFQVETKDALLHAISEQYVEAVEVSLASYICVCFFLCLCLCFIHFHLNLNKVLLEHEESIHKVGKILLCRRIELCCCCYC